ncbi:hypothetical protein LEP1GSC170_5490 [Leptospira interrogans serovar Bataviae str. HAI135]|nr:hypothetical protein LEP1GSC170_5490 [Leptospira interrogans serovar Bataviae str. HAI135]
MIINLIVSFLWVTPNFFPVIVHKLSILYIAVYFRVRFSFLYD